MAYFCFILRFFWSFWCLNLSRAPDDRGWQLFLMVYFFIIIQIVFFPDHTGPWLRALRHPWPQFLRQGHLYDLEGVKTRVYVCMYGWMDGCIHRSTHAWYSWYSASVIIFETREWPQEYYKTIRLHIHVHTYIYTCMYMYTHT